MIHNNQRTHSTHFGEDDTTRNHEVLDNLRRQIWYLDHPYPEVSIYIKGLCNPNPGFGTFGVIFKFQHHTETLSDFLIHTTNNEVELFAAMAALDQLIEPHEVDLYSNSQWLIKAATGEHHRGCHPELWAQLDRLAERHLIDWHWVRSHSLIEQARLQASDQLSAHLIPNF